MATFRRPWTIPSRRESDDREEQAQRRRLDEELAKWSPGPFGRRAAAERREEPIRLQRAVQEFAPRDIGESQAQAFRGEVPGQRAAAQFGERLRSLQPEDRIRLQALAEELDARGLTARDLVAMAERRPREEPSIRPRRTGEEGRPQPLPELDVRRSGSTTPATPPPDLPVRAEETAERRERGTLEEIRQGVDTRVAERGVPTGLRPTTQVQQEAIEAGGALEALDPAFQRVREQGQREDFLGAIVSDFVSFGGSEVADRLVEGDIEGALETAALIGVPAAAIVGARVAFRNAQNLRRIQALAREAEEGRVARGAPLEVDAVRRPIEAPPPRAAAPQQQERLPPSGAEAVQPPRVGAAPTGDELAEQAVRVREAAAEPRPRTGQPFTTTAYRAYGDYNEGGRYYTRSRSLAEDFAREMAEEGAPERIGLRIGRDVLSFDNPLVTRNKIRAAQRLAKKDERFLGKLEEIFQVDDLSELPIGEIQFDLGLRPEAQRAFERALAASARREGYDGIIFQELDEMVALRRGAVKPGSISEPRPPLEPSAAVSPTSAAAEAPPQFGTRPPPQFGSRQREFLGEQGGLQSRMFTPEEVGQRGQIGLEDVVTPRRGPVDDVIRDLREERSLQQELLSDPGTRRVRGATEKARRRIEALQIQEEIISNWQRRGLTLDQQADELAELRADFLERELRTTPGRGGREPAFGTAERTELEFSRRGRRPPRLRTRVTAPSSAEGDALDEIAARLNLPERDPFRAFASIEDALPRVDPDAPTAARPLAVGGGTEAFAAPLRPFEEMASEVVSSDNPVVHTIIGKTGINPSVLQDDPVGRSIVAYWRQRVAAEQLTDVAVSAAVDVHAQRFTGLRGNIVIPQAGKAAGTVRNVTPKAEGASKVWQDVYSRPDRYTMKPSQRAEIDDYLRVVDEVEFLRVQAGLKPRATRGSKAVEEGWFYVPRQVKGIRGVELRRPSSPGLQRHYEEAIEGVARGVRYDANPRATLELHVRQAYKEIADKQLSDHLEQLQAEAIQRGERLFLTPKELVPEPVLQRMSDATLRRIAAERGLRSLRAERLRTQVGRTATPTAELPKGTRAAEQRVRQVRRGERARIDAAIASAKNDLAGAMREYQAAKAQYSKAMEAARRAEVAPGSKFGQEADTIPIKMWRNRFFPRDQAERIQAGIEEFFRPIKQSPFVSGAMTTGNTVRFLASVGDFAEPFIQGQLVFGANPRVWAKATLRHYQAFLDPTVQSRIVREWLPEFQEMAAHGTPIGDQEFFAALREGGGPSVGRLLEMLPRGDEARNLLQNAGRQSFGRFQASYNTGLASSRAGLTRSLKTAIPDAAERQAMIRNLTGGLDTRALGVGPAQRSVEGFALAFSPRFLRSTVALLGDLRLGLRNPRGRTAYRALGTLAASATGLYVLSGLALGKSWEEIETGLNPLNGKKFFSHEVNGDWIGIGGQVRSIIQLMGRMAAEPESLATFDQFDNPLIAFYQSRGAPALNIIGGALEATTGADALPFDTIDSLPDFFKHVSTSALPFAVQGILEGEKGLTSLFGLAGARTSAATAKENFTRLYREKYGTDPDPNISPRQLDSDLARQAGYSETTDFSRERSEVTAGEEDRLADLSRIVLRGNPDAMEQFEEELGDFFRFRSGVTETLVRRLDLPEREASLVQDYHDIDPSDRRDRETGKPDWDYFERRRDRVLRELRREGPSGREAANALERGTDIQFSDPDLQRVYEARQVLREGLDSYYDTESDKREDYRRRNPEIDAKLFLLGRVSRVVSNAAQERVRSLSGRLLGTEIEAGRGERSGGGLGGPIELRPLEPISLGR